MDVDKFITVKDTWAKVMTLTNPDNETTDGRVFKGLNGLDEAREHQNYLNRKREE